MATPSNHRLISPSAYWETRAQQFAVQGAGLRAVCSYGMPAFYNNYIQWLQQHALEPWLRVQPGTTVLDIGCGVGRWSLRLASAGAHVIGIDLSPTMIGEARRRADRDGVSARCHFFVADVAELALMQQFDLIVGVTVLQHVLNPFRFASAIRSLATHLTESGRIVLLEAAPTRPVRRCDSPIFVARQEDRYHEAFTQAGLQCLAVRGLDPAPFKTWFLPWYGRLKSPLAETALLAVTVASLPTDALGARWFPGASWHKVFVLTKRSGEGSR